MYSKLSISALFASAVLAFPGNLDQRAACNADNCLRAVRATGAGVVPQASQAALDCQSFFQTTVAASIPTTTLTISASGAAQTLVKSARADAVTASPSLLPYVAMGCSNTVRYSSACSCAGISSYGTFTAPPSTTVTVTVTATPSSASTCSNFIVQATSGPADYKNKYAYYSGVLELAKNSPSDATLWTLLPNGEIFQPTLGYIWSNFAGAGEQPVNVDDPTYIVPYQDGEASEPDVDRPHALFCSVPTTNGALAGSISCQAWQGTSYAPAVFHICPNHNGDFVIVYRMAGEEGDSSCEEIDLAAVPACTS